MKNKTQRSVKARPSKGTVNNSPNVVYTYSINSQSKQFSQQVAPSAPPTPVMAEMAPSKGPRIAE